MKQVHPEFPVYAIKNWHAIDEPTLNKMIEVIVKNRDKHKMQGAASWWIFDDDNQMFANLYSKFYNFIQDNFNVTVTPDNITYCNVYYNQGDDAVEVLDSHGRQYYHSHKHVSGHLGNHTTIAGVYYANIPDPNSGTIDFRIEQVQTPDGLYEPHRELQYHQMNARPYEKIQGVKTTLVKEITYQPETGDLVLFPSYLDHRPFRSLLPGHRIAINFELKTKEHPDEIFSQIK
jgi:hypothetical protein